MKKIFRKEVIIGLCAIVALLILIFGIQFLKGINLFHPANYYYASYNNVEGLAQSAPVTLNGFKVGQVHEIIYQYDRPGNVVVELNLDKSLQIPEGTVAKLSSDLLGTASIVLELGKQGRYLSVGDTLKGMTDPGLMGSVTETLLPSVGAVVPKIDTLLTNLNAITGNPALTASITRLDAITAELAKSTATLSRMLADLGPATANIRSITQNVDTITGNFADVSTQLSQAHVDSILRDLEATAANVHALTEQLNDPNSSIGLLTRDPALYENINKTVVSLDSLFTDIKAHPKRYINIKVF
ncbi:MAG: MlaD family protein [Muribaculaceae bacterium]|nr:MlaD family protein [Muribaculaceae bacterium]